jgi:ribokinase
MEDKPQVIALGNINADFQLRTDEWPRFGQEKMAHDLLAAGGGKAGNVACIAQRLGTSAALIGRVGEDQLAQQALAELRDSGVSLAATRTARGAATGTAFIAVRDDGSRAILTAPGANHQWSDLDAAEAVSAIARAPAGSVLAINLGVPKFVAERAVRAGRMRGFPIILDPAPPEHLDQSFFARIDYITPNENEAEALTGINIASEADAVKAAGVLVALGVNNAAVRLDGGRCVLAGAAGTISLPPVEVRVTDKTGGGDAFVGALAVALLEGREPVAAAQFAMAAAHMAVARYGAQASFPTRAELDEMLSRLAQNKPERRKTEI